MSVFDHSDPISPQNLKIWNNTAFDAASPDNNSLRPLSWRPLQPISTNICQSPVNTSAKENRSPIPTAKRSATARPSCGTPFPCRQSRVQFSIAGIDGDQDRNIDAEIEAIEKEIGRLTVQLEQLRARKIKRDSIPDTPRGRIVPARFMESKQASSEKPEEKRQRRGTSLGPNEIGSLLQSTTPVNSASNAKRLKTIEQSPPAGRSIGRRRRGASLGPVEIFSAMRSRQSASTTKLKSIKEDSAKLNSCKKPLKALQPKTLFKDNDERNGELSKPASKIGKYRVVPSRYSLIHARPAPQDPESKRRKWSLNEEEDGEMLGVKRSCVSLAEAKSPKGGRGLGETLLRVRTTRVCPDTPRDSGPAKRVAELVGRRTHFAELLTGQNLEFEEEGEGEGKEVI